MILANEHMENKPIEHWKNHSLENIYEVIDGVLVVEEWKDIPNYEGIYQASNFGRIKSMARFGKGNFKNKWLDTKIVKSRLSHHGYPMVTLTNNGYRYFMVHGFVAKLFIPNPLNKSTINHKWGIRWDARASQLEWLTKAEDIQHSYDVLKRGAPKSVGKKGAENAMSRKVVQLDINYNFIANFDCIRDAINKGVGNKNISYACKGRYKHQTCCGFRWMYKEDYEKLLLNLHTLRSPQQVKRPVNSVGLR